MKNPDQVSIGMSVKVTKLGSTKGMFIHKKHLAIRETGKIGEVLGYVPGHGGDVWSIRQDNGVACYSYTEFERYGDESICEWPSCDREALCRTGNWGNRLVCNLHFRFFNGVFRISLTWKEIGELIDYQT